MNELLWPACRQSRVRMKTVMLISSGRIVEYIVCGASVWEVEGCCCEMWVLCIDSEGVECEGDNRVRGSVLGVKSAVGVMRLRDVEGSEGE